MVPRLEYAGPLSGAILIASPHALSAASKFGAVIAVWNACSRRCMSAVAACAGADANPAAAVATDTARCARLLRLDCSYSAFLQLQRHCTTRLHCALPKMGCMLLLSRNNGSVTAQIS